MKIVIADDNKALLKSLRMVLEPEFGTVVCVADPHLLPALTDAGGVDAVMLDMNFRADHFDGRDGLFWLERIRSIAEPPAVVVITAFGELNLAVEAMKLGAADFVVKPWDNDELTAKLRRAISSNRRRQAQTRMAAEAEQLQRRREEEMGMTLEDIKLEHIRRTVELCGGNLSQAAQILGINRQTLYNQLRKR